MCDDITPSCCYDPYVNELVEMINKERAKIRAEQILTRLLNDRNLSVRIENNQIIISYDFYENDDPFELFNTLMKTKLEKIENKM